VTKLGGTPVPLRNLSDLEHEETFSLGTKPDRHVRVPLGTQVWDGPQSSWFVTGAKDGQLQLARRNPATDSIEQATKSWSQLTERSTSLLDGDWTDATGVKWTVVADPDDVVANGRGAKVKIVPTAAVEAAETPEDFAALKPKLVDATWGDIVDNTALAKRQPVAGPASGDGALELRLVLGDQQLVSSSVGTSANLRSLLVASNAHPQGAEDALKGANEVKRWFQEKAGVTFWPNREPLLINTDSPDEIANASASVGYDGNLRQFGLNEMPRDESIRQAILNRVPGGKTGHSDQVVRHWSNVIRDLNPFVRYHEAGHIANGMTWAVTSSNNAEAAKDVRAAQEDSVVNEAFADLFGVAHSGLAHNAVRNLTGLRTDWASLDALRQTMAKDGDDFDVHAGTQLITRPMVQLGQDKGWDAVAEVTGAANGILGAQVRRGDYATVGIPEAARALREAAANRYGVDSATVQHLDSEWTRLGVFQPEAAKQAAPTGAETTPPA
jgi:hypothetical protein